MCADQGHGGRGGVRSVEVTGNKGEALVTVRLRRVFRVITREQTN